MTEQTLYINPNKKFNIPPNLTTIVTERQYQEDLLNYNQDNSSISFIDFEHPLPERLSVREIIKFWIKWFNSSYSVEEILKLFHLNEQSRHWVKNINHDVYKRLVLTQVLIHPHPTFIIKEPLQNLSINGTQLVISLLKKYGESSSILVLTNNAKEALLITDCCYRFNRDIIKPISTFEDNHSRVQEDDYAVKNLKLRRLVVKTREKTLFIDPIDIDFIESQNGKVIIYINNEEYIYDDTLQSIADKVEPYGFYRCHRSYIVNLQKVSEVISWSKNNYSIRLNHDKDTLVPLSRQKSKDIERFFDIP